MLTHINVVSNLFMVNSSEGTLLKWNRDKILSVLPYYHIYGKYPPLTQSMTSSNGLTPNRPAMSRPLPGLCWPDHNCNVLLRPQELLHHSPRAQNNLHLRRAPSSPAPCQIPSSIQLRPLVPPHHHLRRRATNQRAHIRRQGPARHRSQAGLWIKRNQPCDAYAEGLESRHGI